jgi:hypothetical protein
MSFGFAPRFAALLVAALAFAPLAGGARPVSAETPGDESQIAEIARHGGSYVLTSDGASLLCREATEEEEEALRIPEARDYTLVTTGLNKQNGLKIVLVADPQIVNQFPQALEAFRHAAATWESRIMTPITVAIRVDFGPKRFGADYGTGVLGSTDPQYHPTDDSRLSLYNYSTVRSKLVETASSLAESSLYNTLPASAIPTTEGNGTSVVIPSALVRALGVSPTTFPPDANPSATYLPSIGFNSAFSFDFDPSNGISPTAFDFDATAVHEIGHVLGFDSFAGFRAFYGPSAPVLMTVLDLFRFTPGAGASGFPTAQRMLGVGGRQVFYAGASEIELSTGGLDGDGGDGAQSSHWKEGAVFGSYIGIMDPYGAPGERDEIAENDLLAFDAMGFRRQAVKSITFSALSGDLQGDVLEISGTARNTLGAIREAEVSLLDADGATVATLPRRGVSPDGSGNFVFQVSGLAAHPSALTASVTLYGDQNSASEAAIADFSAGDAGGPSIASFKGKAAKLRLNGSGFANGIQIEINGVLAPLPAGSKVKAARVIVKRPALQSGPNRVRLVLDGARSNIVVVSA